MQFIQSEDLYPDQIPLSTAKISLINSLAITFDLMEIENKILDVDLNSDFEKLSLVELRYILYCEQRRWNHLGRNYDMETGKKIRRIIQYIRNKIS